MGALCLRQIARNFFVIVAKRLYLNATPKTTVDGSYSQAQRAR
jgi:hypothetical protein